MKPHKHAELIKAWADGAEIEYRLVDGDWMPIGRFTTWNDAYEYRIKPEPKPDEVIFYFVDEWNNIFPKSMSNPRPNLRLIRDGETGKLKSAEVLK